MSASGTEFTFGLGKCDWRQSVSASFIFIPASSISIRSRWLYSLFVAIDANFRLKLKSRGINDPELGSGLAYFVNNVKFDAHLGSRVDEGNVGVSNTLYRWTGN